MRDRQYKTREKNRNLTSKPAQWLICCEGKSEVIYLTDFIDALSRKSGISSSRIKIGLSGKSCSRSGFQGACGRQHCELLHRAETCRSSDFYERVWIVYDLDADGKPNRTELYRNFTSSIEQATKVEIGAIWSVPCFEYWLASHINYYVSFTPAIYDSLRNTFIASASAGVRCNKRFQNQAGENHCLKPNPVVCDKAFRKPYYNSFECLGGIGSTKLAYKNCIRSFESNINKIEEMNFKDISCCSNMHILITALCDYFGFSSIDKINND